MTTHPLQPADLFRLRLLSDPQIAPDGSRIAFVLSQMDEEKNEYVRNIYVADRDGTIAQFTNGDKDWGPRWSPDGRYLAFVSGRKEKAQIHLLSTRGGESVALTDLKLGAGLPLWSPDSTSIAFVGPVSLHGEEEPAGQQKGDKSPAKTKIVRRASYKLDGAGYIGNRRRHLFLIDAATRTVKQLTEGDFHDDNPSWSPDGRHLAFSSGRSPRWDVSPESDIYVIPGTGGEARQLTHGGQFGRPVFSPDGSRIAFIGHREANDFFAPPRLYSVNWDGSDLRDELGDGSGAAGRWDGDLGNSVLSDVVSSAEPHAIILMWLPQGLYFLGTERGEANIYCAQGGSVHPVTQGRQTVTDFSASCDGTIAYACGDATHPAEVFLQHDGTSTQLTHENDAFLQEVQITVPERISFAGANGEQSEGWLLAPRDHETGKHPLIVYIHGGPHLAHGEALHFEYQLLAGQGFGVFFPNIHGSASYGRDYQLSILGDWGNLDYQDVLAGLDAVLCPGPDQPAREWIDTNRIGIAGGSYGGYMTGWVITHSDRFRAAVVERCLCNIVSFFGTSDVGWVWDRQVGAYPEQDVQKLWDMSPIKYVANVTAPTLVIHSERDDRTPIEQGEQFFNALRRLGKEAQLIMFPEESHGLTRIGTPSRRVERLGHILDWFRQHL